jgi:hypothetical protein
MKALSNNKKGIFNIAAFNFAIIAVLFVLMFTIILGLAARTNAQLRATAVSAGAANSELTIYDNGTSGLQTLSSNTGLIVTVIVVVVVLLLIFLVLGAVSMGKRAE